MQAVYGADGTLQGSIGAARFPMRDDVSEMQTKRVDIRFFPDACPQT